MKANKITKYIEENDLELEDLELIDNDEDESYKFNPELFVKNYITFYDRVEIDFKECQDKEINEYILDHKKHHKQLLEYITQLKGKLEFGKTSARNNLLSYFNNNYSELNEFIEIISKVYGVD